uniref:Protein kinase domain-containing protein n=2 Tax=Meloidogyne TaxID=189290 RepID=A0A915P3Y9_9BILA
MLQGFVNIDSALLATLLFLLSLLLPAFSCIQCCKRKLRKKLKITSSVDYLAKARRKSSLGGEVKEDLTAKGEKKSDEGTGTNSSKDDELPLSKGVAKTTIPADEGNKAAHSSSNEDFLKIPLGTIIGQFTVDQYLGAGGCGVVFKVKTKSEKQYAMKAESTDLRKRDQLLPLEAHVLKKLQFSEYAATFIAFEKCQIEERSFHILVMALLGKSISDMQDKRPKFSFTIGTVLRIGLQAFRGIAFLHSIYYVHRDIKPGNFAVDRVNQKRVYLIDFGLSRSLRKRGTRSLRRARMDVPFRGTPGYCSLNAHKRVELGRHDDVWSLIYMLVDLIHGSLPWFGQQPREKIALLKEHLNDSEYMHCCPIAFRSILDYLRTLSYEQRPDYVGLESTFIELLEARGVTDNLPMDWESEPAEEKKPEEAKKLEKVKSSETL